MTDTASTTNPDPATPPAATPPPAAPAATGGETDWQAEAEKWQSLARKHEDRSKSNAAAAKELEQLKTSMLDDQQKAVAEAKAAGVAEAAARYGSQIVAAEIRAAAAGRLEAEQVATLVDGINLAAFLTDDGDVDTDKVSAFIDGLAPKADPSPGSPFPDLGQGARPGAGVALNGDPLEAALKAKLGIR